MKKTPPSQPTPEDGLKVVHLRGFPPEKLQETPVQLEERLTKFATQMVDFEWRFRKSEDALEKVEVSGLASLKTKSGLKFKRENADEAVENVTPLKPKE